MLLSMMIALQTPKIEVFVRYRVSYYPYAKTNLDELLLYPGGTAFRDVPHGPLPDFSLATLKKASRPYDVGTWKRNGKSLTLGFAGETESLVAFPKGGWYDPKDYSAEHQPYNDVYWPVIPVAKRTLVGRWTSKEATYMGTQGGGTASVVAGSTGEASFAANGTFTQRGESFVGATTANMGAAYKGEGDTTSSASRKSAGGGTWRIEGPLLVTTANGQKGFQLLFAMPHWGKPSEPPDVMIQGARWQKAKG